MLLRTQRFIKAENIHLYTTHKIPPKVIQIHSMSLYSKTKMPKGIYKHKPLSEERKRKIKLKLKGRHVSPLTEFKIGYRDSDEIREKKSIIAKEKGFGKWMAGRKRNDLIGQPCSEETRKKISVGNIGKHHTKETRKKLSLANEGKVLSEETRRKMSESRKGKNHSNGRLGKYLSDITIQKISGKNNHNYGKPLLDTTKQKMSKSRLKRFEEESFREEHIKNILKGLMKRPTSYEKKISELCIENSLPFVYTGDGQFLINFKNPDFVNHQNKVVIEVFYSWFKVRDYGSVENYKEFCRKKYNSAGWKVVFIDENEIDVENWKELCLNKLNEEIH